MKKINVTIWNEFRHEKNKPAVRAIYPDGIHRALAGYLAAEDLDIRCVSLDEPDQGLPDEVLNTTDVLVWWSHCAHAAVSDELVERVRYRVVHGMGLVALHSSHYSKIFRRLMGTECRLHWREVGEKERLWTVDPSHPIAAGVPETFVVPHSEMYGERFDIPQDGHIVFMSWFEGGNVFRSGITFQRDQGKIFYFSPGHESYPIYHDPTIQKVIANAIRWAAPANIFPDRITPQRQSLEPIATVNPYGSVH